MVPMHKPPLLFLVDGRDGVEKGGPSGWHGEVFLGGLSYWSKPRSAIGGHLLPQLELLSFPCHGSGTPPHSPQLFLFLPYVETGRIPLFPKTLNKRT